MTKRRGKKFTPLDLNPVGKDSSSSFNTPLRNVSARDNDNTNKRSGDSRRQNIEKNTARSENSKGHEQITESDNQVSKDVSDQSNTYVASKIKNLSVSSCSSNSSEILDVRVERSSVGKAKSFTKDSDDSEKKEISTESYIRENSSTISPDKTVSESEENVTTNDSHIGKKGHTNLKTCDYQSNIKGNQTDYRENKSRNSKRFKEEQNNNSFRTEMKPKWGDDKKHLRDQQTVSNNSFDARREALNPQGSKHFEDGQRSRYFTNKSRRDNNRPDLKKPQTISNNSIDTQNFQEENWDSLPKNKNKNNKNRYDTCNFSQKTNTSTEHFNEGQRSTSFPDRTKSRRDDDSPLEKNNFYDKHHFDNGNFSQNSNRGSKNFEEGNKNKPFGNQTKSKRDEDDTTDLKEQQMVSSISHDTKNLEEENWDSPQENENLVNKNRSDMYENSVFDIGEWDSDYNGEQHAGTSSNSGTLNVDAQEYVPPSKVDSTKAGNDNYSQGTKHFEERNTGDSVKENTDDDYFTNNYQPNQSQNHRFAKGNGDRWRSTDRHSYPMSKGQPSCPRYSEGSKETPNNWRNKSSYDRRSESSDKEFRAFCDEEGKKDMPKFIKVNEIQQDLFAMPKEYSLGHCVAEDMRMGSGIAVNFKREFKDLDVLLDQRQKQGGLAVLEDKNDGCTRYIYYLVTKRESTGKPTYEKFWSSVKKMRDHMRENNVRKLAIPRLGCGLDRLEWDRVKHMIEFLFRDVDVEITVCNFQQTEDSPGLIDKTCKVVHELKSIANIAEETTIIYLSSEDGHISSEMEQLSKKFFFLEEFKRAKKELGSVIKYQVPNKYFLLYGCIVRKRNSDVFDFLSFNNCLKQINKNNRKDGYVYVGIQAIKDAKDDLIMGKIITLLRNNMIKVDIYICWDGELASQMPVSHRD